MDISRNGVQVELHPWMKSITVLFVYMVMHKDVPSRMMVEVDNLICRLCRCYLETCLLGRKCPLPTFYLSLSPVKEKLQNLGASL